MVFYFELTSCTVNFVTYCSPYDNCMEAKAYF